jgi:hypothetical protein
MAFNKELNFNLNQPDANLGFDLFWSASGIYSASIVAQAAFIADNSQRLQLNPRNMGKALLGSGELLEEMVRRVNAISAHSEINVPTAHRFALLAFSRSEKLMVLSKDELQQIYNLYNNLSQTDPKISILAREIKLQILAENLLMGHWPVIGPIVRRLNSR